MPPNDYQSSHADAAATGCDLLAALAEAMADAYNDRGNPCADEFAELGHRLSRRGRELREVGLSEAAGHALATEQDPQPTA